MVLNEINEINEILNVNFIYLTLLIYFKDLANALWKLRKKLAASISRMRIRYGARQLSQLLPPHLQNEKVAIAAVNPVVTGWMNPFLIR